MQPRGQARCRRAPSPTQPLVRVPGQATAGGSCDIAFDDVGRLAVSAAHAAAPTAPPPSSFAQEWRTAATDCLGEAVAAGAAPACGTDSDCSEDGLSGETRFPLSSPTVTPRGGAGASGGAATHHGGGKSQWEI